MRPIAAVALAAVIATIVAWRVTPRTARLATRLGALDGPDGSSYKRQPGPIPATGGVAVVVALVLGTMAGLAVLRVSWEQVQRSALVVTIGLVLAIVGLVDDVRPQPWPPRLAIGAVAGGWAWAAGFDLAGVPGPVGAVVVVVWIVGVTNSMNLLDNTDGLAAGTAAAAGAALAAVAVSSGVGSAAVLGAALSGAALGFRHHNNSPATIYLGDSGALFFGVLLALLALRVTGERPSAPGSLAPVVILAVPLFDTTLVVCSRLRRRRSPFVGGRDHASHRLQRSGFTVTSTVRILVTAASVCGIAGVVVARADPVVGWVVLGCVAVAATPAAARIATMAADDREREVAGAAG